MFFLRHNQQAAHLNWYGMIDNGNRTEWSPIRPVIIRVINKTRQPWSRSLHCQSPVWLQTELDNRKSYYHYLYLIYPIYSLESNPAKSLMSGRIRTVHPQLLTNCTLRSQEIRHQSWNWKGRKPNSITIAPSAPYQKFRLDKRSELHFFRGIKLSRWVPVLRGNQTCPMW